MIDFQARYGNFSKKPTGTEKYNYLKFKNYKDGIIRRLYRKQQMNTKLEDNLMEIIQIRHKEKKDREK